MSDLNELERISNLFNAASIRSKSFFDKCSKTKYLAVKDYYRAEDEYVKLATKTLSIKKLGIAEEDDCYGCLSSVKTVLESGQLNQGFVDALETLRVRYLDRILKPAVRQYLNNEAVNKQALEALYANAMKIESLIEVIQFMNKVQDIE